MTFSFRRFFLASLPPLIALAASCGTNDAGGDANPPGVEGTGAGATAGASTTDGRAGVDGSGTSAGGAGGGANMAPVCMSLDDGSSEKTPASLKPFTTPADPGPGGILFDASGEVLAYAGYEFPPASKGDPAFVDGWQVEFSELLVTVDNITLSSDPDTDLTDQSRTGAAVARATGPWAIDLHTKGPLPGKGGGAETAVPIAALSGQNLEGGAPFDPTLKYAFGFDIVTATGAAQNVNLNAQGLRDYQEMIDRGYAVLYVGTATFKGGASCTTTDASYGYADWPTTVKFRLGFASPTTYANCQNPDLMGPGDNKDEEHPRGIQVVANRSVIGQVTVHTDHPFWESVVHDSPAHFDPLAAVFAGCAGKEVTVTTENLKGVDFTAFRDGVGAKLPWRKCVADAYYRFPSDAGTTMHFDPRSVPVDPNDASGRSLRDYYDYLTYNQSTQGHLNSDGLCYVKRNYSSPP